MDMSSLSREQVRNLTPEEQVALGNFEAERVRKRQRLIKRAGLSNPRDIVAGLLAGAGGALAILGFAQPKAIPFAVIVTIAFVGVHVKGMHRRLDAVTQLLEPGTTPDGDRKPAGAQPGDSPNGRPTMGLGNS